MSEQLNPKAAYVEIVRLPDGNVRGRVVEPEGDDADGVTLTVAAHLMLKLFDDRFNEFVRSLPPEAAAKVQINRPN